MQSDQDWLDRAKAVVRADAASIEAVLDSVGDDLIAVARRLAACRGKILVTGSGTSGNVAARGAHILSVCGAAAFHLSPGDGLHGGLGVLQADDVVLALSKGGSSAELNDFCARAKRLCSGVIAITADPASPLAALSDHVITLKLPADGDLGGVVATGSSLAAAAVHAGKEFVVDVLERHIQIRHKLWRVVQHGDQFRRYGIRVGVQHANPVQRIDFC